MDAIGLELLKTEPLSPVSSTEDRKSPSTKILDPVDKWRTRVLFCQPKLTIESWAKRIEKQMAVLRVAFPFLTERQIRGKAWKSCGLNSVMGDTPRSGLSPEIKKEFTRPRYHRFSPMSKSRVKKEKIKIEKDGCPYIFTSPKPQFLLQDQVQSIDQTPCSSLDTNSIMSGITILSRSSNGSVKKMKKHKRKCKRVDFNIQNDSEIFNKIIIPETPTPPMNINSQIFSLPFSPDSVLPKDFSIPKIIPTLGIISNCSTQPEIECSSSYQTDASKTISGLDNQTGCSEPSQHVNKSTVEGNFISQDVEDPNNDSDVTMSVLDKPSYLHKAKSTCSKFNSSSNNASFGMSNAKMNSISITTEVYHSDFFTPKNNVLEESLKNQALLEKNLETTSSIYNINSPFKSTHHTNDKNEQQETASKYINSNIATNSTSLEVNAINYAEFDMSKTLNNASQNFFMELCSQDLPLLTQTQASNEYAELPSNILLSNFCCEYNKAFTKTDFKPTPYRSYYFNKINQSMKKDFNKVIPSAESLEAFFEAPERSFEQIEIDIHEKVNNILLTLEEDGSYENSPAEI